MITKPEVQRAIASAESRLALCSMNDPHDVNISAADLRRLVEAAKHTRFENQFNKYATTAKSETEWILPRE